MNNYSYVLRRQIIPEALCILFAFSALPAIAQTVILSPGANVQALVDANPDNTTFIFQPGTYRFLSIKPKDGDRFVGQNNPVLSGAQVLTSFTTQGNLWVAGGQTQMGQINEDCDAQHPRCMYPEDLYFDNIPLLHVASVSAVVSGTWYFDYPNHSIYFADDPRGHLVEASVTRSAFSSPASNVTISGLTMEKYAVPGQFGVVGDQTCGPNWIITNNEIRLSHGVGVNLSPGSTASLNYIHNNGQMGLGGSGYNQLVQGNTVSFNGWAGFDSEIGVGGMKFTGTSNLVVSGNIIHDNIGAGSWTDGDNINTLYENNMIFNNTLGPGIQHEISYSAIIRNNTICNNAFPQVFLWGSQILIQNSQNVQVYGNTVEVPAAGGNGIGIIQQNRGSGAYGPYVTYNNSIFFNTIIGNAANGAVNDYNYNGEDIAKVGNILFDFNTYHLPIENWWNWSWFNLITAPGLEGMHALGHELHGTTIYAAPTTSRCRAQL